MGRGASSARATISREEWERKMDDVSLVKSDMNRLVMDFLVTEGYHDAARAFEQESGTKAPQFATDLQKRGEVRAALQNGETQRAVEIINDMDPEILETQPRLAFRLQQQAVIEMIRKGDMEGALNHAQEYLAPRGEDNAEFLSELEQTVALLAFEDHTGSPLGSLLDVSHRQKAASEVNAALMAAQDMASNARLSGLIKMALWAQNKLEERADFPHLKDLSKGLFAEP